MNDEELWNVLDFWSYWESPPPAAVPREVCLPDRLDSELVLAIQGVRRCGKSTLLGQLVGKYRLDRQRCLFANFEDPRFIPYLGDGLLFRIVDLFQARFPDDADLVYCFDEIQNVPNWEAWLHSRVERKKERFVVTGSNASLLAGELSSKLTGRHRLLELYPFDFSEACQADPAMETQDYLVRGGFPKVVLSGGDLRLLQQYFRDIVERDIAHRVGARGSLPVLSVIRMVFESCGSEMSLRRIAAANGLSAETVGSYLQAAEDAYLLFPCPYFTHSSRQRKVRNQKYYPVDTGLRKSVISNSSPDLGKALECAAFLALKRRFREVFYWRNHREVDFVVLYQGRPLPIQVTWGPPQERHFQALDEFYEAHPTAHEALFISANDLRENFAAVALLRDR